MPATINVRLETDPIVRYFPQRTHAKRLEPTAVSEYGTIPTHKPVQAAKLGYSFHARSKIKMVRIAQYDLSSNTLDFFRGQAFDSRLGCHRHKERSSGITMGRLKLPRPGTSVSMVQLKIKSAF